MAEIFKLPGSSYEEVVKIIKAYGMGKVGVPVSLDEIAQTISMDKTIVSRNNGFLVQMQLISEGNKKSPTDLGLELGRAYNFKKNDIVEKIWRDIIEHSEFLIRMISAIKIREGMEKGNFVNHIIYSSGNNNSNNARTGANTIIEIYKAAGLVDEVDGKIIACDESKIENEEVMMLTPHENSTLPQTYESKTVVSSTPMNASSTIINININISVEGEQLNELPDKLKAVLDAINR